MSVEEFKASALKNEAKEDTMTYIFGPCSAESREQVLSTAKNISSSFPKAIFRAGIWKPRTRPNNFEGIGEIGLSWLKEVQSEYGLRVATEVANTKHVELCLKAGIDILWIGARTTVNPFYVQEIAEALKGCDIPVYVKNPVSPDLSLWLGAIERLENVGIKEIVAIHRGFQVYDPGPYRNAPQWDLPIELMAVRPEIPIICDISHIGGNPSLFQAIAQKALDLNMAGLHIEVHPDPPAALSDAKQQITPEDLISLVKSLHFRRENLNDPDYLNVLQKLRNEVDEADDALIRAFVKRMQIIKRIGILKKENDVTILQVERWKNIVDHYLFEGQKLGLSEGFLKGILSFMHDESMRNQHDIMNQ